MADIRQFDEKKVVHDTDATLSDRILRMDREQSMYSQTAKFCRVKEHGRLGVHASGSLLICCVKHCDHQEFVAH